MSTKPPMAVRMPRATAKSRFIGPVTQLGGGGQQIAAEAPRVGLAGKSPHRGVGGVELSDDAGHRRGEHPLAAKVDRGLQRSARPPPDRR